MNKIKTLGYVLKASLTNIEYFNTASKASFWFLFKYVAVFVLLVSLIHNVVFSTHVSNFLKQLPEYYELAKQGAYNLYPNDLEITLNNGIISTNKREPLNIKIPEEWKQIIYSVAEDIKVDEKDFINNLNLLVINPESQVSDFTSLNTLALLTNDSFVVIKEYRGEEFKKYEVYPLEKNNKIQIFTKNLYLTTLNEAIDRFDTKVIPQLTTILNILFFSIWIIIFTFVLMGILFSHLFTSLWGLLLSKIMGVKYTYGQIYKMGMLFFPLFLLIGLITMYTELPYSFFVSMFIYTVITVLIFNHTKKTLPTRIGSK